MTFGPGDAIDENIHCGGHRSAFTELNLFRFILLSNSEPSGSVLKSRNESAEGQGRNRWSVKCCYWQWVVAWTFHESDLNVLGAAVQVVVQVLELDGMLSQPVDALE
jgi:hypothetical protein